MDLFKWYYRVSRHEKTRTEAIGLPIGQHLDPVLVVMAKAAMTVLIHVQEQGKWARTSQ